MHTELARLFGQIRLPCAKRSNGPKLTTIEPVLVGPAVNNKYLPGEYKAFWQLREDLEFVREYYGIRVRVSEARVGDLENVIFILNNPTPVTASLDVKDFRRILGLYPPEFIRFCGITQARIVKELYLLDHEYWEGAKQVGGVAFSSGPIYIAGYPNTKRTHHEIFHRADQQSGELDAKKKRRWRKLNLYGEPYLYDTYWQMSEEEKQDLLFRGFAKAFGRVDEVEDRATIAEMLLNDPAGAERKLAKDDVLYSKASGIMLDLYRWSTGRMNAQYWQDLKDGKVNEDYWK